MAQSQKASPSPASVRDGSKEDPREAFRVAMEQTPLPGDGCFIAKYPEREWLEDTCVTGPDIPFEPKSQPSSPFTVGGSNDFSAQVSNTAMPVISATGTFPFVSGVTTESGNTATATSVANGYSVQLNTDFFQSAACGGSPNPNCRGWEQFVFSNDGSAGSLVIQYWLIDYNATCPPVPAGQPAWIQHGSGSNPLRYCYKNAANRASTPNTPITHLGNLTLTGSVTSTSDRLDFWDGSLMRAFSGDNVVSASAHWTRANFGVYGFCCGHQAVFAGTPEIHPKVQVVNGDTHAPTCSATGYTGETSNLDFANTRPTIARPGPAMSYSEITPGFAVNCSNAITIGDTHLTTFDGFKYDFQAAGDFLLARRESDFLVESRQVSGAPVWPYASVNSAVASQFGKTQVAVCLGDSPLFVNGSNTLLKDGEGVLFDDGVQVWRAANVYYIKGPDGDSVTATVNGTWIDVSVGVGLWPDKVEGLLANREGDPTTLVAADGSTFESPFSFEDFYAHYGDSWRVDPKESLLNACGEVTELSNPAKPFTVRDLPGDIAQGARAACLKAGLEDESQIEDCMIDVAVIGDTGAALVYVGLPVPVAVGEFR
jgi:hypothetical protein